MPIAAWRAIKRLPENEIVPFAKIRLPGKDLDLIQRRLDRIDDYSDRLQTLSEAGIAFVTEFDPDFPAMWIDRLGDKIPSHLFVAGNLNLLNSPAVGIVGSRDVDAPGMGFSREIAEETVRLGHGVISGGAKGVDEIAMQAALGAGGSVVGILAESLLKQMKKWDIDTGQVCLASPFAPEIGFMVANAMTRNKFIYAGSVATVVVSSALDTGGTWAGATEALKLGLCPVLVRATGLEGNRGLIARGGVAIAAPSELRKLLKSAGPAQGSLL